MERHHIAAPIVAIFLLLITVTTGQNPKVYESIATVCSGEQYEVGCGLADGTSVMNVEKVYFIMNIEDQAMTCADGLCNFDMGGEQNFTDAWEQPNLVSIYRQIRADCHGKSSCIGRLPLAGQLSAKFAMGTGGGVCGWDLVEYVAKLVITTECIDVDGGANVVPTLEPYEFEVATQGIETTTIPVTTIPTEAPTTVPTKDPAPITTEMEKQPNPEVTVLTPPEPASSPSKKKMNTGWIILIVFGALAGVAVIACVCVAVYVFCIKSKSVPLKTPLDDKELGALPTGEKQPMNGGQRLST